MGSLERALGSLGLFGFEWVHSGAPRGRRFHSSSHGFTRARVRVVGFVLERVGSLVRAYGLSGSFGNAWVHSVAPRGRRVH